MLHAADFFDLNATTLAEVFAGTKYVWETLRQIVSYIERRFQTDLQPNAHEWDVHPSVVFGNGPIFIGEGTIIQPTAYIEGPAIIGRNCRIGQGAFVRANTLLADGAVVGHACETKNAVLLEHAVAAHFAYVGDSILGQRVNMGAGTKLSNLAVTSKPHPDAPRRTIVLRIEGREYDTGLTKFGAILGDDVETGCNSVTNPGTLVGPRTLVYPLVSLPKGYTPPDSVVKLRQTHEIVERRK